MTTDPTTTEKPPRCTAPTKSGKPCPMPALLGDEGRCREHSLDPAVVDERRAAVEAGIAARKESERAGPLAQAELAQEIASASTPAELAAVLARVAGMVLAGTLPPKTGQVLAALGNVTLSALKADLNERLERLQAVIDRDPAMRAAWKRR